MTSEKNMEKRNRSVGKKSEMKPLLALGFEAPEPQRKEEFLRSMKKNAPSMSYLEVLFSQAAYIRKWVWGLSVLIFAAALIGAEFMEQNIVWHMSALMPILAMTVVTETGRSEQYHMTEFEFSTRFSLKTVILSRLCILGLTNVILIGLLAPIACIGYERTFVQTSLHLLCPYLLTVCAGLWIVRNFHGKESLYLCAGLAAGVSVGHIFLSARYAQLLADDKTMWWIAAVVCFGIGTIRQGYQIIEQTEELAWN